MYNFNEKFPNPRVYLAKINKLSPTAKSYPTNIFGPRWKTEMCLYMHVYMIPDSMVPVLP